MEGWIKLHRKLLEWKYADDMELLGFWTVLLLKANHKDGYHSHGEKLRPGQFVTGRKALGKECKLNEHKVDRFLKKLEIEQQIEQRTNRQHRVITITNWTEYQIQSQDIEQQTEQRVSNDRATSEQRVSTYKNNKNKKNPKNERSKKDAAFLDQAKSILDLWNSMAQSNGLNPIDHALLDKTLIKLLTTSTKKLVTNENWIDYFREIEQSDFLMGRKANCDFVVSFAWAIKIDNINKVQRGEYGPRKKAIITTTKASSPVSKYDNLLDELTSNSKIITIPSEAKND